MDIDAAFFAIAEQVALALVAALAEKRFDRPLRERQRGIGHRLVEVDADHPPEAAADRAGADGIVEGKQRRGGRAEGEAGSGIEPSVDKTAARADRFARIRRDDAGHAFAELEGGLQGLQQA